MIEDCRCIIHSRKNCYDQLNYVLQYWWNCKKTLLVFIHKRSHFYWEEKPIELVKKQINGIDDAITSIILTVKQFDPMRFEKEFANKYQNEIQFAWKVNYNFVETMCNNNSIRLINKKRWNLFDYNQLIAPNTFQSSSLTSSTSSMSSASSLSSSSSSKSPQTNVIISNKQSGIGTIQQLLLKLKIDKSTNTALNQMAANTIYQIKHYYKSQFVYQPHQEKCYEILMVHVLDQVLQKKQTVNSNPQQFIATFCKRFIISACSEFGDCFNYEPCFAKKIIKKAFVNNLKYWQTV